MVTNTRLAVSRRATTVAGAGFLLLAGLLSVLTQSPTLAAAPAGCYTTNGVSGFVTDAGGDPIAGAPVIVHAEPDRRVRTGTRYTDPLVGWSRTDQTGCYHVKVSATRKLLSAADDFGIVNLRVTLQRPDALEVVTYPRRLVASTETVAMRPTTVGESTKAARFRAVHVEPGAPVTGAIHQSFGPQATAERQALARRASSSAVDGATVTPPDEATSVGMEPAVGPLTVATDRPLLRSDEKLVKKFKKHPVLVGQWWSRMDGVRQTWAYTRGASSEMESAQKFYSGGGGYEQSTKIAKSTDSTVTFPTIRGKAQKFFKSYFRYAKYMLYYCDPSTGCQAWSTKVKPYSWERGALTTAASPPGRVKKKNCSPYIAGSGDTSRGSTALTWTNGVTVGGDLKHEIGAEISLSSRTGFTEAAENRVHFTRAGHLCGLFGPLSKPGAVLARR